MPQFGLTENLLVHVAVDDVALRTGRYPDFDVIAFGVIETLQADCFSVPCAGFGDFDCSGFGEH